MTLAYTIKSSKLAGSITLPTSKSHTMRAILFASLAKGESIISQFLPSPDTWAMIQACQALGAQIQIDGQQLIIQGVDRQFKPFEDVLNAGNSGQVLRFIGAIAGHIPAYTIITGDASIRHSRPVLPLLSGLRQMGAVAESMRGDNHAPIIIKGKIAANSIQIEGQDSQPVSALLMSSALLEGTTTIEVLEPGETPWIELTLYWLRKFGIEYINKDYIYYQVKGISTLNAFHYTVPGDFSSLAFPVAAALLTQSSIKLYPVDMNDVQGDKALLDILSSMGAKFEYQADSLSLIVHPCSGLTGIKVNINHCVDALSILAVIGCYAEGETIIEGAAICRQKESDRIAAICQELKKMGANIQETEDGLIVKKSQLKSATVSSHEDHRIAMSLACSALLAQEETRIENIACVSKSFPNFSHHMSQLGMLIQE